MTHTSDFDPTLLLPLFRRNYSRRGAEETLTTGVVATWLFGIASTMWAGNRVLRREFPAPSGTGEGSGPRAAQKDLFHAAIGHLWEKVQAAQGLCLANGDMPLDLRAFTATSLRHVIRDMTRKLLAKKRGGGKIDDSLDDEDTEEQAAKDWGNPEAQLMREEAVSTLVRLARAPTVGLSATHLASFIAQTVPSFLSFADCKDAQGSNSNGFARPPEETLNLVMTHIAALYLIPAVDTEGQQAFAWIARSSTAANEGWQSWKARNPAAARTAVNTVQRWYGRALIDIKKHRGEA